MSPKHITDQEIVNFNKWLFNFKRPANEIATYIIFIASIVGAIVTIAGSGLIDKVNFLLDNELLLLKINFWLHIILGTVVAFMDVKVQNDLPKEEGKDKLLSKFLYFGIKETKLNLKESFERANNEIRQFYLFWRFTWICWVFLYGALLLELQIGEKTQTLEIIKNLSNNLASLMLLYCFMTLSIPAKLKKPNYFSHLGSWMPYLFATIFLTYFGVLVRNSGVNEIASNFIFSLISGVLGGSVTALLIGRLDSKLISGPIWVLFLFYLYAGIQGFFGFFDLGSALNQQNKVASEIYHITTIIIVYLALFFKCLLFLFIVWSIKSKKLFYYFISVNKLQRLITNSWLEINKVLTNEGKI